jgi:hypothetical protein
MTALYGVYICALLPVAIILIGIYVSIVYDAITYVKDVLGTQS